VGHNWLWPVCRSGGRWIEPTMAWRWTGIKFTDLFSKSVHNIAFFGVEPKFLQECVKKVAGMERHRYLPGLGYHGLVKSFLIKIQSSNHQKNKSIIYNFIPMGLHEDMDLSCLNGLAGKRIKTGKSFGHNGNGGDRHF
jgi:hypothetical protein